MSNELKKRKTPKTARTVGGNEATSKASLCENVLLWIWETFRFGWYQSPCAQGTSSDKKKTQVVLKKMRASIMQAIIILMLYFTNRATYYSFHMVRK